MLAELVLGCAGAAAILEAHLVAAAGQGEPQGAVTLHVLLLLLLRQRRRRHVGRCVIGELQGALRGRVLTNAAHARQPAESIDFKLFM